MPSLPSSSSAPPCDELARQGLSMAGRQPPAPPIPCQPAAGLAPCAADTSWDPAWGKGSPAHGPGPSLGTFSRTSMLFPPQQHVVVSLFRQPGARALPTFATAPLQTARQPLLRCVLPLPCLLLTPLPAISVCLLRTAPIHPEFWGTAHLRPLPATASTSRLPARRPRRWPDNTPPSP